MGKENNMVMTADQYVVAELLQVKQELEETKQQVVNLTQANTYLTIENIKVATNLKELKKFFKVVYIGSCFSIDVVKVDSDGDTSYATTLAYEWNDNFQELLDTLGLREDYDKLVAANKEKKEETKVDPQPTETTTPTETKESV